MRAKSRDLAEYYRTVGAWSAKNHADIRYVRTCIEAILKRPTVPQTQIRVDCFFAFEHSRIWTKDGRAKQLDTHNFLKPCHDALKDVFSIDDRHFFAGDAEKVTTTMKEYECVVIRISEMTPRTLNDVKMTAHKVGSSSPLPKDKW